MTPYGQTYRPTGQFSARNTIYASLVAMAVAVIAAGVVWLWEISPIPTVILITPGLQGVVIGLAIMVGFGRAKMRNPFLALVIGALCGAVSVGLVHYGYYQHTAYVVRDQAEKDAGQPLPPELHDHPEKFLDLLFEKDGIKSRGWLGFMAWRATIGENIIGEHNMKLTGIGMWILWGFEAAIVVVIAAEVSVLTAKRPYCEDCDCWFASPLPLLALPPAKLPDAVAALKSGDPQQVQKLFPIPYYDKVGGSAIISLHVCPRCKESLADVRLQAAGGKDLVDKTRLSGLSIPPEVAAVILVRAAEIATKPMWTPWSPKPPATENPSAAVGTSVDTRKTGSS